MTTVGEPIEPEAWRWYYDEVGKREAVITDTWWMTETGGFLGTTVPAIHAMKPGSCGPAAPGIHPVIYDETGAEIAKGSGKAGNMCIRNTWPGIMQTIWGDRDRYVKTYFGKYTKNPRSKDWRDWPFLCGDGAVQSADGYYRILGRIDDVINVAGHRLGTKEIESACLTVPEIAEAAVVPVQDELKGRVPEVYVAVKPGVQPSQDVIDRVIKANEEVIGKIARPKHVYIVPDMPKTRSGKIMRRVLAAISNRRDVGDVTTLANPDVVEQIRVMVQGTAAAKAQEELPEDIAKFGQVEQDGGGCGSCEGWWRWSRQRRNLHQPPLASTTSTNLHQPPSEFHLRPHFEHLVPRDLEEGRGAQGVTRHEREQLLAPVRHAGPVGGDERLAPEEERRSRDGNVERLHLAGREDVLDVRVVHEPVPGDHAVKPLPDGLHRHALQGRDVRHVLRHHRQ